MIDPTLELQAAIVAALRGAAAVTALVGTRVYDAVKPDAPLPYVRLGQPQVLPDRADCIDGAEVVFPVDCFASGPDSVSIKRVAKAVAQTLDGLAPTLTGHRVILFEHEQTQYLEEEGGLVQHANAGFRVLTEPTD